MTNPLKSLLTTVTLIALHFCCILFSTCVTACVCVSVCTGGAERSLHPETDEYFPFVCSLLNRLLGKCMSSTSFKIFLWVFFASAEGGVFYTPRHMRHTELWLIHDPAIKALWVRGLCLPVAFRRYVSPNCQIFVTAVLCVPVESLSWICIITSTDRLRRLMLLSWVLHDAEFDRWYRRYAASASDLDRLLLRPTLLCCPETNRACLTGLLHAHVVRELKPTHTQLSNPSSSEPTRTVSVLLKDKLSLRKFTKNTIQGPTASHVDCEFGCETLLAGQFICLIKISTNEA